MTFDLKNIACFGVAGNFTGHLEQAGEDKDFINVKTKEETAPKGIFPTYLPLKNPSTSIQKHLTVYPFSDNCIIFPSHDENLQTECECVLACSVVWENHKITNIIPIAFASSNDCSIRKQGAKKISEKKNWGACSKGYSTNFISIDEFSQNGNINDYKIACYLKRNNEIFEYGENSFIKDYSYIYEKLEFWLKEKFNEQKNEGPLENLSLYLKELEEPNIIMVSIGATRYTQWGTTHFLQNDDVSVVIVYPSSKYSVNDIEKMIEREDFSAKDISFLVQKIKIN